MHEGLVPRDRGGDAVTTDVKDETTESVEPEEKSQFARGALLGLVGGAIAAILLISVAGSVISLVDDIFGSNEEVAGPAEELTGEALLIATGEDLATTNGCVGCHSTDGTNIVGPTWQGLFGSERSLVGGGTVTADEAYLAESIVDPTAAEVDGFPAGVMPATYGDSLSAEDIEALVAYMKSL